MPGDEPYRNWATTPELNTPPRSRVVAALDVARKALRAITEPRDPQCAMSRCLDNRTAARAALRDIETLLGEPQS